MKLDLPSAEECKKIDQQIEVTMRLSLEDRKGLGLVDKRINKEMNSHQVANSISKVDKKHAVHTGKWLKRVGMTTRQIKKVRKVGNDHSPLDHTNTDFTNGPVSEL